MPLPLIMNGRKRKANCTCAVSVHLVRPDATTVASAFSGPPPCTHWTCQTQVRWRLSCSVLGMYESSTMTIAPQGRDGTALRSFEAAAAAAIYT